MSAATGAPSSSPSGGATHSPLRPARQRTGAGPIGWVGPLLALLMTAIGLVLLRDGVFAPPGSRTTGWPGGTQSWLSSATTVFDGLTRATWMIPVGVVIALVGLHLLLVSLRRRTRKALALRGGSGAYLLPADVARRASAAASDVDGVLSASSSATRRRVTTRITTTASGAAARQVADAAGARITESLAALEEPPAVRVRSTSAISEEDS